MAGQSPGTARRNWVAFIATEILFPIIRRLNPLHTKLGNKSLPGQKSHRSRPRCPPKAKTDELRDTAPLQPRSRCYPCLVRLRRVVLPLAWLQNKPAQFLSQENR